MTNYYVFIYYSCSTDTNQTTSKHMQAINRRLKARSKHQIKSKNIFQYLTQTHLSMHTTHANKQTTNKQHTRL